MIANQFTLPPVDGNARKLTTGWLLLGLAALIVGGLYTVLVVLSRTPFFQEIIPWVDFFPYRTGGPRQPDRAGLVSRFCRGCGVIPTRDACLAVRLGGMAGPGQPRRD